MTKNALTFLVFTVIAAAALIYQGAAMNPTKATTKAPSTSLVCFPQDEQQGNVCVEPKEVRAVYTKSDTSLGSCPADQKGLCTYTNSYTVILLNNNFGLPVKQSVEEVMQKLGTASSGTDSGSGKNG